MAVRERRARRHLREDSTGPSPTASAQPAGTKSHVPADHRGAWISGEKGNGVFRYHDSVENRQAGIAGKEIRFKDQYIAIGGFPPEAYYRGNSEAAGVVIATYNGTEADATAADEAMRIKLRDPTWQRPADFRWNHAGPPGSKTMELVEANIIGLLPTKDGPPTDAP